MIIQSNQTVKQFSYSEKLEYITTEMKLSTDM